MENVVIIGSGPAGYTAAIYAARANLAPVLVSGMQPGGQLTQTTDVENYPGFESPVDGTLLVETMRKQAERLGVRVMMDEVEACQLSGDVKKVKTGISGEIEARAVIVATGASARYLGLDSEKKLMGKGVSACATCDGAFFKGQRVAVVGGGDTAMEDALYLSRMAERVTVVHRRDQFRASKIMADRVLASDKIDVVWDSVVEEVLGDGGQVTGLRLRNVKSGAFSEIDVQGVFIAIGHVPNTAFLSGQLETDAEGYIVAERTRTSVPGVFAAGDVQDRFYKQAVTAAGSGCMAALEAERYIDSV
ncbi:MAG: thioredoxin-disulfide reductase [Kiritimatiellae bacterium]|nr:thioredoxin-disulfide reductase [Kiritimatiellia bacterium]MDD3544849.1 thioredoxin-disulfide reductase [Kiritimatiellia bacterium]MDD4025278.1 thioredoxin-disulfide reductase [Kiritimatiellia bacterium]MDD4622577.1 thioredoxin-disulfide reductase [Kiritimatiellia bacterium]